MNTVFSGAYFWEDGDDFIEQKLIYVFKASLSNCVKVKMWVGQVKT